MIDWSKERATIAAAAAIYRVDPDFVEAIRMAENGGPGREFGVLSEAAQTYTDQLRVACISVAHRLTEYDGNPLMWVYHRARYNRPFVAWFSSKWAPAGAENDPNGINANWLRNAWKAYDERIAKAGMPL